MIIILLFLGFITTSLQGQTSMNSLEFDMKTNDLKRIHVWKYQDGDNPAWVLPDYDDSGWQVGYPNWIPKPKPGLHWYRAHILLKSEQNQYDVMILRFSKLPVAFEIYWDGTKVGENGQVGLNLFEESPGNVSYKVKLKRKMTEPGNHILAIRFSNHRGISRFREFWTVIGYHADWIQTRAKLLNRDYLRLGIYLTTTILSLALFFGGGRHRAFVLFGIYCFLLFLNLSINPFNDIYNINIIFMDLLLGFRYIVYFSAGILLNIFFIYNFDLPKKKIHFLLVILLSSLIGILKMRYFLGFEFRYVCMLLYSVGLLIYAVRQKKSGSMIALTGLMINLSPVIYRIIRIVFNVPYQLGPQFTVFVSLCFIFLIILSISRQIKEQNRLYETLKLQSHRLETQLLKNQIQPHFISNTLHSIKSWFRENPKKAGRLVQTLADEFRIINKISSEKLIPIEEEIQLCHYHLELMGSRREVKYALITENFPEDEKVPPLIFHTLIENGLTHAYLPGENGRFWLSYQIKDKEICYQMKNDGSQIENLSLQSEEEIEEGLGLAYVKARLEESFPSNWRIVYGRSNGNWEVNIYIKK